MVIMVRVPMLDCSVAEIETMTGPIAIIMGVPRAASPVTEMPATTSTIETLPMMTQTVNVKIGMPVVVSPVMLDVAVSPATNPSLPFVEQ